MECQSLSDFPKVAIGHKTDLFGPSLALYLSCVPRFTLPLGEAAVSHPSAQEHVFWEHSEQCLLLCLHQRRAVR